MSLISVKFAIRLSLLQPSFQGPILLFLQSVSASFRRVGEDPVFEPRSHLKSRLSLIVRVNVVLNRTVVVDSDWRFDNLCGSHL